MVKSVFTPAFHTACNIQIHLVRSKFYLFFFFLKRTDNSNKCNTHHYQVGRNVKERYEFSSHVTKEIFKTNHYFDCNSKSLIYPISCKVYTIYRIYIGEVQISMVISMVWIITSLAEGKAEREEGSIQRYLYEHL